MEIILINCNSRLLANGINMNTIGAGNTFVSQLSTTLPSYQSWEYDFAGDVLLITAPDGITIPDMSKFGEVAPNGYSLG